MSTGGEPGHLFPRRTERNRYRYFFYDKHHGRGGPEAARWATDISEEEEFGIFNQADRLDFSDEQGNLYGIRLRTQPQREVLSLGTLGQQVAKFPEARSGPHWHGYPLGPLLKNLDPPHPPERPLPKDGLQKMVDAGLLTRTERTRLLKGKMI
jgi:hypothetical protein